MKVDLRIDSRLLRLLFIEDWWRPSSTCREARGSAESSPLDADAVLQGV